MLKTHGIQMNTCIFFFKPLWLLDTSVNEDYANKKSTILLPWFSVWCVSNCITRAEYFMILLLNAK